MACKRIRRRIILFPKRALSFCFVNPKDNRPVMRTNSVPAREVMMSTRGRDKGVRWFSV